MLTVLESIKLTTEYFESKGIESPRINAELLLAHILNCKRLDLYLMFDRPLKKEEIELYREYLGRRGKNEPLQYIVGSVEFYGLEFKVNKNVLIPRPETEILVETIIENTDKNVHAEILDIGAGSGNIAVVLAKYLMNSHIVSIDRSSEAIDTAKNNAEINSVSDRISFEQKNVLNGYFEFPEKFDIIVSNPPYISSEQYSGLRPELVLYEPKIALTDDADGLTFYRAIADGTRNIIKEGGRIYFEVGEGQAREVQLILENNGFKNIRTVKDYLNIERVISGEL